MIRLRKEWAALAKGCGTEDKKLSLKGVLLIEGTDCQQGVATTGRLCALVTEPERFATVEALADAEDMNVTRVLVEGQALAGHLKGLGKKGSVPYADAVLTGDGLLLLVGDQLIKLPHLEGHYPDVQRIIPKNLVLELSFGLDVMRQALEVIAGLADPEHQRVVLRLPAKRTDPFVLHYQTDGRDVQIVVSPMA